MTPRNVTRKRSENRKILQNEQQGNSSRLNYKLLKLIPIIKKYIEGQDFVSGKWVIGENATKSEAEARTDQII